MIWGTHLMAGLSSLWLLEPAYAVIPLAAQPNIGMLAGAAAIGALLPDLDASQSKIKHLSISCIKPFLLPSQLIHRQWGHRSLLHSLPGLGLVVVLSICWVAVLNGSAMGWQLIPALLLGYASHLVADACTKTGIPLLYPRRQRYHLLPPQWRVTTGSQAEEMLFVVLALSAMALFLRYLPFSV